MANLVTAAEVKVLVNTSLTDGQVDTVIEQVEADITALIGGPQDDGMSVELVETVRGGEGFYLFMPTEISSITSVVEDTYTLDSDNYQIWDGGQIERLPAGTNWGERIVVTYKPTDDRIKRTRAIIDLVRLVIEQTGMKEESIAGEYKYVAPDNWEAEFRKVLRRLMFTPV